MERKDEIKQAARDYDGVERDYMFGGKVELVRNTYEAGAEWIDTYSASPWHSVADGDLPKEPKGYAEDMPFVVVTKGGEKCFAYFGGYDWDGVGLRDDFFDGCDCALAVKYWMEIPQIPKESEVKDA